MTTPTLTRAELKRMEPVGKHAHKALITCVCPDGFHDGLLDALHANENYPGEWIPGEIRTISRPLFEKITASGGELSTNEATLLEFEERQHTAQSYVNQWRTKRQQEADAKAERERYEQELARLTAPIRQELSKLFELVSSRTQLDNDTQQELLDQIHAVVDVVDKLK